MSDSSSFMTSVLDWFGEIENYIPGIHTLVGQIIFGEIPLADAANAYELAEAWGVLAQQLADAYEEVSGAADGILQNWQGDGAAATFATQWYRYLEALSATAQSAAAMQQGVQAFGNQVELMKFMAALNLIMLAITIYMIIAAAIPTGGASLGAAIPAVGTAQIAIRTAASKTIGAIANIVIRAVLKTLSFTFGRAMPILARAAIPSAVRAAIPRLAGAALTRVVPAVVRRTVADIARRIAARGITRAVANRLAAQALRGAAGRELRLTLARVAAERGVPTLASQSVRAVQRALAREIQEQLARKFTGRVVTEVAAEGSEAVIRQFAAAQVARVTFGRELAGYVGVRIAFGAGFMGGGNLLGQTLQVASGTRSTLDWGQAGIWALEGAAFGAGMWGGPLGHAIGGAIAGGGVAAAHEAYEHFKHGEEFRWSDVGHGAFRGAVAGTFFGTMAHAETMRLGGGNLRIGEDVHVLRTERGGLNILAADGEGRRTAVTDTGQVYFERPVDGGVQRGWTEGFSRETGFSMPDVGRPPGDGPPARFTPELPSLPDTAPVPVERLPAGGPHQIVPAGVETGLVRDGGGGGGGGPHQPVRGEIVRGGGPSEPGRGEIVRGGGPPEPGRPVASSAGPRAPEVVRAGDGAPPAVERGRVPVGAEPPQRSLPPPGDGGPPPHERTPAAPSRDAPVPVEPIAPRDHAPAPTGHQDQPLSGAGAEPGLDHSPESVRQGTVRMDEHPDLPLVHQELADRGFNVVEHAPFEKPGKYGDPHVTIREIVDPSGQTLRVEREVHVIDGMRFLDLEHELGHVRQMTDPVRFPDGPPPSEVFRQHPDGHLTKVKNPPQILQPWQNTIVEYHVRLQEFIRLAERGVDAEVLAQHASALREWNEAYWKNGINRGLGHTKPPWAAEHFPDIPDLQRRAGELRAELGLDGGPRFPRGMDDGGLLQKSGGPEPPRDAGPSAPDTVPPPDGGPHPRDVGPPGDGGPPSRGGEPPRPGAEPVPYELVPVERTSFPEPVEMRDSVVRAVDRHVAELVSGRPAQAVDLPHRAVWDNDSSTLTVHYPDGLRVDVVVQVNSELPPGHPAVLRPTLVAGDGAWVQAGPAGVILPAHIPADPMLRAEAVRLQLDHAWQTLHQQMHPMLSQDGAPLAALERPSGTHVPVIDAGQVTFRDVPASEPSGPRPITPEWVRDTLAGRSVPEQVRGWVETHLAVRDVDGSLVPKSRAEIDATVAALREEAFRAVSRDDAPPPRPDDAVARTEDGRPRPEEPDLTQPIGRPPDPYPPPDAVVDRPDLPPPDPARSTVDYGRPVDPRTGQPPPLFDGLPRRDQVNQGQLGDCGVVATFSAVAGHRPDAIAQAIRLNPDGSITVRIHDVRVTGNRVEPTGRVLELRISPDVPVRADTPGSSAYLDQSRNGSAWASVLEKAFAGVDQTWPAQRAHPTGRTGYGRMDLGTGRLEQAEIMSQLTGEPAVVRPLDATPGREAATEAALRASLDHGRPVVISIRAPAPGDTLPHRLIADHAYDVVAIRNGVVELRNPWGIRHPDPMPLRDLLNHTKDTYATLDPRPAPTAPGPAAPAPARPAPPDAAVPSDAAPPGRAERPDTGPVDPRFAEPRGEAGREIEGSGYRQNNRALDLPDVTPGELAQALRELRPHFPHQRVWVTGETFRIETEHGQSVRVRVEVGEVHPGSVSLSRFDPEAGEHVIRLSPRLAPENVARALIERATVVFVADVGGSAHPPETAAQLKQLDVLATERARVVHSLNFDVDATAQQRQLWSAERARLNHEFRVLSERLGILVPADRPDTAGVQQHRDHVWADLSDPARAALFEMADPDSGVGASAKARSFLPLTREFREPYNAVDNLSYFVERHAPPEVRQRFETEVLPGIRRFQAEALDAFKAIYRDYFPSTSAERPLPAERAAQAATDVQPLVERAQAKVDEIRRWGESTGVPELGPGWTDRAIEVGEHIWRTRYEEFKAIVDELLTRYNYLGEPIGYIGSMQDGMRGPHKAMAHADLRAFDIDMYVVHPADFDARYELVMERTPDLISRGKIFIDPDRPELTLELVRLSTQIANALGELFPGNDDVGTSTVVLRREPPY